MATQTEQGDPRRSPSLKRGAALSAGSQFLAAGLAWATGIVVARMLGPSGAGDYGVVLVLLLALVTFSGSGIGPGILYELSRGRWSYATALRQVGVAGVALGLCGAAVGLAAATVLGSTAFRGIPDGAVLLALAGLPSALVWIFAQHVGLAREDYVAYAGGPLVQTASCLVLTIVLAAAFGLQGAAAALALSHLLAALTIWQAVRRSLPPGSERSPTKEARDHLRSATVFGLKIYIVVALNFVALRMDLLILNAYASSRAVGQYAVAVSITGFAALLPRGLAPVVFARIALSAEGIAGSRDIAMRAVRHGTLLALVSGLAAGVILVAVPIVYGNEFGPSSELGLLLLPGACALGLANVAAANIIGSGRADYAAYTALIVGPVALTSYFLLIPTLGATGAALGSSLSYMVALVVSLMFSRGITGPVGLAEFMPGRDELRDYRSLLRA